MSQEAPFDLGVDSECVAAVTEAGSVLEKLGHHVDQVTLEVPDELLAAFMNVLHSGLADHGDFDWERTEPHIQANRAAAMAVDSLTYVRSVHDLQRLTRRLMARWGTDFDVLLTPTMSIQPPPAGQILPAVHAAAGGGGPALEVFQMAVLTSGFNMSGQPAMSLPTHMTPDGTPIGLQLVGGPWAESALFRLAGQLEQAMPWAERRPPLPVSG